MSRLRYLALPLLACLAAPALAQDYESSAVSGDVGAVSDYRYRGISRSDESPALQGRLQLQHPMGLYGGVAASTVDIGDADVEGVLFGGYKADLDGVALNGRLSYNAYSGDSDDLDYWEFMATAGYDFDVFYGSLTWAASPEYINESGMAFYYGADLAVPLQYSLTAKGHLGFQFIDDEAAYAEDYTDWRLGLWYNWAEYNVDFGLEYVDTDLDDNQCGDNCGATAVFTAKKPFGW